MSRTTRTAAAGAALLALFAAGCGGPDEPRALPVPTPSSSLTPSRAPATPPAGIPGRPRDGEVLASTDPAATEVEKQVSAAWHAYWAARLDLISTPTSTDVRQRFTDAATGTALSGPIGYADELAKAQQHSVGGVIAAIEELTVNGTTAVVTSCLRTTVHAEMLDGRRVTRAMPYLRQQETLVKQGEHWLVDSSTTRDQKTCTYR